MSRTRGFTLIELMIVVLVLAIIAAIALPSYVNQVRKSRRNEVEAAIQQIALLQERFRADCPSYGTALGTQSSPVVCATDPIGPNPYLYDTKYYTITLPTGTATTYQITATAVAGSGQDKDKNPNSASGFCTPLTYDYGVTTAGVITKKPDGCW